MGSNTSEFPSADDAVSELTENVGMEFAGMRLDQVAAALFSDFSRARLQSWIKTGHLTVNDKTAKPKDKLLGGEKLSLTVEIEPEQRWQAQNLPLDLVYEDKDIIVINKPAGLVVHPGAGVPDNTLLNAVLYHYPELATIPRAGIVHRLDKDTGGLMVVARSLLAHTSLIQQLQDRSMGREYDAIVMGEPSGGGKVDKPIGRHPSNRIKMAVIERGDQGREAVTHYRVQTRYSGYTHLRCRLETGRTHQIRVHMAHIRHPLIGDPVYAGRQRWRAGTSPELKAALTAFPRQALHARQLSLLHPQSGEAMSWQADLPEDMQQLLRVLADETQRVAHG